MLNSPGKFVVYKQWVLNTEGEIHSLNGCFSGGNYMEIKVKISSNFIVRATQIRSTVMIGNQITDSELINSMLPYE